MRQSIIAGVVILVFGAYVVLRGVSFTSKRDVVKVGDLKITADEQRTIPQWVGGAAIAVGVGLIVVGTRKRS